MQKAFEKIVERLEECTIKSKDSLAFFNSCGVKFVSANKAIEIVNQVAEEYKSNDGWIPCNEKTPSGEFYHLVSTAKGGRTIARYKGLGKWWDLHSCEVEDEVIAWQPLPEPYQPEKDCNNCANYTEPDEVDNGCYMCCKGLENNYQPKSKQKIANPISPEQLEQLHKNIRNI